MLTKKIIIDKTKGYLAKKDEILMAFLFGSRASDKACSQSDIDLALFLKEEDPQIEGKIWNDLEGILQEEIDLIILNRAPSTLSWSILRKGIPLLIKDRKGYLDFFLNISQEAEDFIEFNLDTWRRKEEYGKRR